MAENRLSRFSQQDEAGRAALLEWWQGLDAHRGDRAELRRCRSLEEVVVHQTYHDLRRRLLKLGAVWDEGLALTAAVLAHARHHQPPNSLATQMAQPKIQGGNARVSGLRFRRLLKIDRHRELLPALVRILRLLDGQADILRLAQDAYHWSEQTRRRWAYDYYSQAPEED